VVCRTGVGRTYWTSLLTESQAAKEVRLFDLSTRVQRRYREETTAHPEPSGG
jgi:hypothetical protein